MDDDFSGSLTPPISPYISQPIETEIGCMRPPCFTCTTDSRDAEKPFSVDSYLASGSLKRLLLRLDPSPVDYEAETVELFGFQWVTETALVESASLLFGFLRQLIHKLQSMTWASSFHFGNAANKHIEAEDIRKQCTAFLQYVKVFVYRYLEPSRVVRNEQPVHPYEELESQLPSSIVQELHTLTLYLGHLSELPSSVISAFTTETQGKVLPPVWHLLHLYLDVHWSVLEILYLLGDKMMGQVVYGHHFMNLTGENITNVSLFESHCTSLIWDLINLAVLKYGKVRPSEALTSSPFHCTCIKEVWVLLIQLLDQRNRMCYTEPFWSWINKLLKIVVDSSSRTDEMQLCDIAHCKEPLGFSWWVITHIALLYRFGCNGTTEEKRETESDWSFVEDLAKQSCDNRSGILEEQLRMHLHCCLALSDLWNSNITTVTQLWEYYSKNLNNSFNIPWLGLKGFMAIRKTPFSMLELVKNCCSNDQYLDLYNSGTSFQIFLHILALQIKKAKETCGAHPWKQIKGRVYSKFHQRKMQELTETGLQNFINLFLVLAEVAELEDVVSRASDLLGLLSPAAISSDQKALIWRGYFAFLLMYVEKNLDIGVLAEKLSKEFQETAKEFLVTKNDLSRKVALWKLLSVYIDGVQEVFETSCYLHLSEEKLLNDGFSLLLPACRESELNSVLNFLQTVLARLRNVHKRSTVSPFQGHNIPGQTSPSLFIAKERHLAIASALWKNFFVHLKRLRLSQSSPPQLADTAAGFTLLALDMPSTAPSDLQPQPLLSMLQLFGWDDMVHPALVSRFLSHLIQHSPLVEAVSTMGCTSYQGCSVRSWLRCVLQMHMSQSVGSSENVDASRASGRVNMEQLVELTRLVFKFPEVEHILLKAQLDIAALKQDPKGALFQFLKTFGEAFSGLQTLADKTCMISRGLEYIGDVVKYVKPYMVNKGPAEGLQLAYRTVGCIMKYWAPMLATSKAQPLLLCIIDCLLLPNFVYQQDKALYPAMISAVRESLPLYLQGLSFISSVSSTQSFYLKQQLQKVIVQYFSRFLPAAPSGSGIVNHPVLTAVCESCATSQPSQLRKTVLQVIRDNFLQFKGYAPPPRLASVLAFLLDVFQKSNSTEVGSDAELLLPAVLKCIVLVSEPQVKKISTDILQYLVESCPSTTEEPHTHLASVLRQFIQEYMGSYSQQVFNVLEMVVVLSQPLIISLIPTVTKSLKESEHKQGLGRNTAQRDAYKRLLSYLGERGQQEILELNDDSC